MKFEAWISFFAFHLSSFKDESDPEMVEFWIVEMEKKFKVMRYPEEEKVNLATYMFQGQVEYWWQALQRTRFTD